MHRTKCEIFVSCKNFLFGLLAHTRIHSFPGFGPIIVPYLLVICWLKLERKNVVPAKFSFRHFSNIFLWLSRTEFSFTSVSHNI